MKTLIPYLIINSKCEEALNLYTKSFDGEITFIQKYADTEYDVSEGFRDRIAHAEFRSEHIHFYASDGFEGEKAVVGSNIALSITFEDEKAQIKAYEALKVQGQVTMDFNQTSVESRLVTLIDKFGIHWYLNLVHK